MTGQLAVLLCGAFVALTGWSMVLKEKLPLMPVIALWMAICVIALIAGAWRATDPEFYGPQSAVHSMWWLVMPTLVVIISRYWTRRASPERLMLAISRVVVIALTANAVLAVAQLSSSNIKLGGFLPRFWSAASPGVTSVAQLATENGRYTGIFDQPAEAGTAYGIALLCLVYLLRRGERWQVVQVSAVLVVAGGVLSISKVFFLVALPITALVAVNSSGLRLRIAGGAALSGVILVLAGAVGWLPSWGSGHATIEGLLHPSGSLTSLYTANRYGEAGTLGPGVSDVLRTAPWSGFGLGGLNTPYDSQWLEILALSGVIGVILMGAILAVLGWRWLHMRKIAASAESMLAGAVLLLAAGSSFGFPSMTANRVGILIWLILGVLLGANDGGASARTRGPGIGDRVGRAERHQPVTLGRP